MKTLILGLGNPILGDDALGLRVAALVRQRLPPGSAIEVDEEYWGGLRLMERLVGYDKAILIDAICTGTHPPGTILRLGPDDLPTQHTASSHDVSLPTALQMGRAMHLKIPDDIRIIAVEAANVLDFCEQCSPAVSAALPAVVERVLAAVN
ncbi:MAG: hydrogenase maturation protease [Chloroflexi bacterium]|nr:hydrogenase maturation protease [Chloroflexota bacterium]